MKKSHKTIAIPMRKRKLKSRPKVAIIYDRNFIFLVTSIFCFSAFFVQILLPNISEFIS